MPKPDSAKPTLAEQLRALADEIGHDEYLRRMDILRRFLARHHLAKRSGK